MLNSNLKKKAIAKLKAADQEYQIIAADVTKKASELYEKRKATAEQIIPACEKYINTLANSPKEFDKSVSEFKVEFTKFSQVIQQIKFEADKAAKVSGLMAGAGTTTGVGVAAFAPTAAMAIATTFGTASTGTAISALSGAAATNAALAWLGGGAVVAGGGGMAAGNALLAMAGPVGWAIGGTALVGSVLWAGHKNEEIAQKANQETAKIKSKTAVLNAAKEEIAKLFKLTQEHADGVNRQLNFLKQEAPSNYLDFSDNHKIKLAALINNIQALSQLLNKKLS
ncbi:hypothetical protein IQ247_11190 [Plectonema cf. radiosum LEGE 06105]|uniref:Uncharacterized protein n=1 Tax=Plectonema cf. radiosum LEGE 06105 TaxID=945769 RepID=A0A8J7EZS3_9CYAN|nr:hypothetical protein [Plectonema radiosum]MBE9213231.1 hypothetical protein [Plectonema cf. radiosum LEGE 06105]